jgi:hypothetical protein
MHPKCKERARDNPAESMPIGDRLACNLAEEAESGTNFYAAGQFTSPRRQDFDGRDVKEPASSSWSNGVLE